MSNILKSVKTVFLFLFFLEIFFWVGAATSQWVHTIESKQKLAKKDSYVIVCIGESLTLVGGEDSFPSQLQKILNERFGENKFRVINEGAAGQGTFYFKERMPQIINNYHPDMIVAMVGILDPVTAQIVKEPQVIQFIKKFKLYKLWVQINEKAFEGWNKFVEKQKKQFVRSVKATESVNPQAVELTSEERTKIYKYLVLAEQLEANQNYQSSEALFEKLLQINQRARILNDNALKKNISNLILKQKDYERFVERMRDFPWDSWGTEWIQSYCHGSERTSRVKEIVESMVAENPEHFAIYGYLAACYQQDGDVKMSEQYFKIIQEREAGYISDISRENYQEILNILVKNKIEPVFVQYPSRPVDSLKKLFNAHKYNENILFVDNESVFGNTMDKSIYDEYFTDRTFGDMGHMTPKGNRKLAENIIETMIKSLPNITF